MNRFFYYFIRVLAAGAGILAVAIAVLFIPGVQKSLMTWVLSGPETEVSIDEVRLRPGSAVIRGFDMATPEARVQFADLDSRFRPAAFIFRGTVDVESLTLAGLTIETEEAEEPEEIDFWEVFDGILKQPPVDFRVATAEIDGVFRSPGAPAVEFVLQGRDLNSRSDTGRIEIRLATDDEMLPGEGLWFAEIEVRPEFDGEGLFRHLCADLTVGESAAGDPFLVSELCASRSDDGEEYRIEVRSPKGAEPDRALLTGNAEWLRGAREASGAIDLDVSRARPPLDGFDDRIPEFRLHGRTEFAVSPEGDLRLASETGARLFELAARLGIPEEFDELTVDSSVDLVVSPTRLSVNALNFGVSGGNNTDLARVHAPSSLDIGFGDESWSLADSSDPLLVIAIPGIPAELVDVFVEDYRFTAAPVTAEFALYARDGRFEMDTRRPLNVSRLSLAGPEGILLERTDINLSPSGFLSASEFGIHLAADASAPQLNSLALEIQSSGAFPLAETTSTIQLQAGGLPVEGPFSEVVMNGTFHTGHENGSPLPSRVRFEGDAEGTARPSAPAELPGRVAWDGELARNSGSVPYELNVFLPENNDTGGSPAVSVVGTVDPDWRQTEGRVRWGLPDWWTQALADRHEGVQALHLAGELDYGGALSPADFRVTGSGGLHVDTGERALPGEGRFSLSADAGFRLGDTVVLESFDAAVSPEGGEALVRAGLRRAIAFGEEGTVFDQLPQGELLEIDFGELRLEEWIPEAQRGEFTGGEVRGGFKLYRENNDLHFRPKEGAVELAGVRLGRFNGGENPVLSMVFAPRAVLNESGLSFGVDDWVLYADQVALLEAALSGTLALNGIDENAAPVVGTLDLNGDLASVESLLGEGYFPRLAAGVFELQSEFEYMPEDGRTVVEGHFLVPELRGRDPDAVFSIESDFSGQSVDSSTEVRLIAGIERSGSLQDLDIAVEALPNGSGTLPSVTVRAVSDFLDLVELQALAGIFEGEPAPDEPPPEAPAPLSELLPVALDAELNVSRMRVMPDFDLSSVSVQLDGDDERIRLREMRARLPEEAEIDLTGTLAINEGILSLVSSGSGRAIRIEQLLRKTQGIAEPDIEGSLAFDYDVSARGARPEELVRYLEGAFNLTASEGRIRLTIPDGRMDRLRRILNMQEGAIGSAVARLAGAPPGVQALADSISLLTNIPYESLDVALVMTEEGRTLEVDRLEFVGPYLYADGSGRLEDVDLDALDDTRLNLEVNLGTRRALREQFEILDLLSPNRNHLGYQMLRQRPVSVTGTLGDPDLRDVWNLLIQAGTGAATARESPGREERSPSPFDAIRDVLGL